MLKHNENEIYNKNIVTQKCAAAIVHKSCDVVVPMVFLIIIKFNFYALIDERLDFSEK